MLGGLTLADGFDLLGAEVEEVWWGYAVSAAVRSRRCSSAA